MFLAIKELLYYKKKYLLVTIISILLIFMVLFLSGLANGLSNATSSIIRDSDAAYYVVSEDADNLLTRSVINLDEFTQVKDLNDTATPFYIKRTTIQKSVTDFKIDCTYFAVDPSSFMMVDLYKGNTLVDKNQIVLSRSFLDEGIQVGDVIVDTLSGNELEVVGFTNNESYAHSPLGVVSLDTYNGLVSGNSDSYQAIAIKTNQIEGINEVGNLNVLSKSEVISNIPGHAQEQLTINMILVVLLLVSAAILAVFFYIITIQKLTQFATLKAIGTSMKKLSSMVVWQVLLISGVSVLVGDTLTILMAMMLPNKMPFSLQMSHIGMLSIAFVVISVVSSLFTLRRVANVDPIVAIGGGE